MLWARIVVAAVVAAGPVGPSQDAGPPATTPPANAFPGIVQGTETLSQSGNTFAGTIDLYVPDATTPPPAVYLRLSPSSTLVVCHAGSAVATGADQVRAIPVSCVAPTLPKLFDPVIEVDVAGSQELFLPVTLRNDTEDGAIEVWPFAVGAAAALLTLAVAFDQGRRRKRRGTPGSTVHLGDLIGVDAAYSPGDSWVTNLTTVAGILGAVLAASGILPDFLVSVPAEVFEAVLLVLLGLGGVAPVVYALFSRRPPPPPAGTAPGATQGTVLGLLLADLATLTAAYGQLVATALLIHLTTAGADERAWLYLLLAVASVMLVVYSVRSVASVLETSDATDPKRPVSPMTHAGTISATL